MSRSHRATQPAGAREDAAKAGERNRSALIEDLFICVLHEISNPLAAILAHLEVLRLDRGGDPVVAEHLDVLIPEVGRLAAILAGAKTFARDSSEAAVPLDVAESLRGVAALLSHHYHASGVGLDLEISPDLPPVLASPAELQQVWLNYLNNAFHAVLRKKTADGAIRIRARHEEPSRQVVVEIIDNGTGMDAKVLKCVRESAVPGGSRTGRTCIGTREAARILRRHGGSVDISSVLHKGTTVRVTLPAAGKATCNSFLEEDP